MSMTAKFRQFSDEEFTAIVLKSHSMCELMHNLGYKASTGGSRQPVKDRCLQLGLDIPHMNSFEQTAAARSFVKIPDELYFIKDKERKGQDLKKRLLDGNYVKNQCAICGLLPE